MVFHYSNLKSITKTLKSNLRQKYNTLEKIASDVDRASTQVTGGGAASGGLGDLGDLMEIFFNQNTYNGTLKINGGIIVDYIESSDGSDRGTTDVDAVNRLIQRAIKTSGLIQQSRQFGESGSLHSLQGTIIKGSSISGSSFTGGIIRGSTLEDVQGLDVAFTKDYLDMYSISSTRNNFNFHGKRCTIHKFAISQI